MFAHEIQRGTILNDNGRQVVVSKDPTITSAGVRFSVRPVSGGPETLCFLEADEEIVPVYVPSMTA